MKCKYCNQKIPKALAEEKRKERERKQLQNTSSNWNVYCNEACFRANRRSLRTDCVQCGTSTNVRKGLWAGRELCRECYKTKICKYLTNDEVMYLVTINPGVGLKYFVKELWTQGGRSFKVRERLRYFLEEIGEYDGNDYINWLENPKMMRRVLQDDVPEELLWSIRGERRSVVSNQVKRVRIREGLPVNDRNQYYVYIPPFFRWGKLEELRNKIYGE